MSEKQTQVYYSKDGYVDEHKRKVIINRKRKLAYVVEKEDYRIFNVINNRYTIACIAAIFVGVFTELSYAAIALIILVGGFELYYRLFFLKKLQVINNIIIPEKPSILDKYSSDNNGSIILIGICALALVILLAYYVYITVPNFKEAMLFLDVNNALLVYGGAIMCGFSIYVLYSAIYILINRSKKK